MGTISKTRLAGLSLILGPVITTICYFIQQIAAPVDGDSYGDVAAALAANQAGGSIITITSVIIPLALTMLLYGMFFILSEIRGNGEALVGYAKIPMVIGLAGWSGLDGSSTYGSTRRRHQRASVRPPNHRHAPGRSTAPRLAW